ncbi:Vacuolar protein sorting-associated protein 53 [Choanephora cucurbitarum]|uniref:Vacuolar protein sorting-associated protein 53 n=1 Tax=Choanephora cucurbitarum TaxID=101091 RepID=A0A1C7NT71_9FUNG|nr:Vacuolar protein sorting-associated protein 53 [Choanephora cucurbitarum]
MSTNKAKVSRQLEAQALAILNAKSFLDSPEFDAAEYLNRLFPTEKSLASVDGVLTKLQVKMTEMSREAERLTDTQYDKDASEGNKDLQKANQAIQELFKRIQDIKFKAAQSESMVQEITQDVKSLDYAKRHLTHSVTVLKRLQMLVTAVDQLEVMSRNKQYKESAQLLQAVLQLMQHFRSYKSVPQISQLSDRIASLKKELENCVIHELENGFNQEGQLVGQSWILHDACLVADVLGDETKDRIVTRYVDLQLVSYRQIFRPMEEVSQLDNVSRRYAFLKRILKTCDDEHADIFPSSWAVSAKLCDRFCEHTRLSIEIVMKNELPDVKELLKALQLTIEFESQLTKRYEKFGNSALFDFEKKISAAFQPYLYIYINAEDATIASMIDSYVQSDAKSESEDDGSMAVLPSSTDLFYFYRETLAQTSKFSTGKALFDLYLLFSKHLNSYCNQILLGGLTKNEKQAVSPVHFRFASLALNTAEYCHMTSSQLEEKLKEKIDNEYVNQIDFQAVKDSFMKAISVCIDTIIKNLEQSIDSQMSQMTRLPWSTMDTVGDQSDYVSQILDIIKNNVGIVGKVVVNRRYYRTFSDRFAELFVTKFLVQIFKCKMISEIGAEQLLLDTHSIKTLLLEIPSIGASEGIITVPSSYSRIVNKGITKIEAILKTVMSPIEPSEGYVENYFLLIGDKNLNNFTRLLELKGVRKPEQNVLIDMFYKRLSQHDDLSDNSKLLPSESLVTSNPISSSSVATIPSSITTSLTTMASTAASNFNINNTNGTHHVLSPTTSSPTEGTRGRLNENFRKLMMTGMAFRKDLQERREHT